ncbi:MAG: bifunctional folylpolyglutamate synthase/dihydrofolate synthase [Epulopiscium sp.]|nr:bifunctional folylpolyglutamate synthase/dihydrofolate synthase [Candidatus Epulonipiscium sp.]
MQYNEAISYINQITPLGFRLGLERIQALLDAIGNPEKKLRCIHVAGTNGKGSACAMLKSILTEAGYRTAVYTSPHLEDYTERFEVNGVPITKEEFAQEVAYLIPFCKTLEEDVVGHPTVFELLTAVAFHYFAAQQVDIVLLEVGLGGRFDATNVIEAPLLSLIMSIGMDHMDYLGNTIEEIASEKGGIIKENSPTVLYSQSDVVYNKIAEICKNKSSHLYYVKKNHIKVLKQDLSQTVFSVTNEFFSYPNITLSLLGTYQIENCCAVLLACHVLQSQGISITEKAILNGIKNACWNGRMELIQKNPTVIIDGAHNVDGIEMLVTSIIHYFSSKNITLLLGVLEDKEYNKMVQAILPYVKTIVLTEPHNERKLSVAQLEKELSHWQGNVYKNPDIGQAYSLALQLTPPEDVLICCGSLYMIGKLRTYLSDIGGNHFD